MHSVTFELEEAPTSRDRNPAAKQFRWVVLIPIGHVPQIDYSLDDDGALIIARWRSKHLQAGLPTIDELASFVDCPLSDDDKIPISANFFNGLVSSSLELHDICTPNDVQPLFRLGHGGTRLDKIFWVVASSPPYGGTERAFIHFWDDNIRGVVELLLPTGRSMRNSSEHTATMRCRPDYAFLVNNFCPFRGEERSPESTADPKQELADKLAWAYDPAPYVLGEVVEVTSICISHWCFGRLLCDRTLLHSGGDLPSTAGSKSPIRARYRVGRSKTQSRPNQEYLPLD